MIAHKETPERLGQPIPLLPGNPTVDGRWLAEPEGSLLHYSVPLAERVRRGYSPGDINPFAGAGEQVGPLPLPVAGGLLGAYPTATLTGVAPKTDAAAKPGRVAFQLRSVHLVDCVANQSRRVDLPSGADSATEPVKLLIPVVDCRDCRPGPDIIWHSGVALDDRCCGCMTYRTAHGGGEAANLFPRRRQWIAFAG